MNDAVARSGLVVLVPEAEDAVAPIRQRLDSNAALGADAHITVLFPFVPPTAVSDALVARLAGLFARIPRFAYELVETRWFGDDVLWLAPADDAPFHRLTEQVFETFPDYPPFEGQFDDVVPHLTVGHQRPLTELRAAETEVRLELPIHARADAVTLLTQHVAGGPYEATATFPLG